MHSNKIDDIQSMNFLQVTSKSDIIGGMASTLCLIHCLATPLVFVAQAEVIGHGEAHPMWWGLLDIVFLVISYFAVWWSRQTTRKIWIRYALWVSWVVLTMIIFNEKLSIFPLPEEAIYIPTISLIALHLYNRRYCHCNDEECCADQG